MSLLPSASPSVFSDKSMWGVVLGNAVSIVAAIVFDWDLDKILWIYWSQSVIIGLANFVRIMKLKSFSTEGLTMNGLPVPETESGKRKVGVFFLLHYGFFHFGYLVFISTKSSLGGLSFWDVVSLLLCIGSFALSHVYSLRLNQEEDFKDKRPNVGTLMFYPYLRIVPMHLSIFFVVGADGGLLPLTVFMFLKTGADAGMHAVEHRLFRR